MSEASENQVVADLAVAGVEPVTLDPDLLYLTTMPAGARREVLDLERHSERPWRKRGWVTAHAPESLCYLVNRHKTEHTLVYASREDTELVAVFNEPAADCAEWADHRAVLKLEHTPEWKHWASIDGKGVGQHQFADHIEDGLAEIRQPDGATLLELAQTLIAKTKVNFKSSELLTNGERQFVYEEELAASAGRQGQIKIPSEFVLGIAPFVGTEPYKVTARLRFRINEGTLSIGYKLVRPHEVIDAAFTDTCDKVKEATGVEVLLGSPVTGVGG